MIKTIIKKHLRIHINPEQIDKVAEAIAKEIGEREIEISGEWIKLKEVC